VPGAAKTRRAMAGNILPAGRHRSDRDDRGYPREVAQQLTQRAKNEGVDLVGLRVTLKP
jgi:hypothetical protein